MKVAMVSEHASPLAVIGGVDAGGQNVHVAALATALGRIGVDVTVHTRRDDRELPRRVAFAPNVAVEHVDAGPPTNIPKDDLLPHMDRFARELARAWRADPPDVVHSHFWMSGRAALAAASALGIPVVHTFHALGIVKQRHQGDADTSPPTRLAEERAIVRRADHILATATEEAFELVRMGADRSRLSVVPCGVDLGHFQPHGSREPRSVNRHRVLVVSRLVPRKGIADAITAVASLPDADLVIAGGPAPQRLSDDPEARRLLDIAARLGCAQRITLRGSVSRPEMPALFRSADVVVSVPWYEPFGIVPVEAMACGVPVVASAVGGQVDTVVDGVTGRHVTPRDPSHLLRVLRDVLADVDLRAAYGRAGAARARGRYGWDRIAAGTLDVYRRVAARGMRHDVEVVR